MERVDNAQYFHARQACYTCLDPHNVVDTGIVIEGEGVLAIGVSCVRDMALAAGFTVNDDQSPVIEQLKAERDEAIARAEEAEATIHQLQVYKNRVEGAAKSRAKIGADK